MKKFKLLSLLLIIMIFISALPVSALALEEPDPPAECVVIMDADTGDILYEKNGDKSVSPGWLTTMMTELLVGEAVDRQDIHLEDSVTASDTFRSYLSAEPYTPKPAIVPAETLTVQDLLYMNVLRAYEDSSCILAEYAYGSVDAFVDAMNRRAGELGCTGTNFVNPSGVNAEGQRTTALDLARIARALWRSTTILNISSAFSYNVPATAASGVRAIANPMQVLNPNSENYYEYAYAGKVTGTNTVSAASFNEMDVIVVVLNCAENTSGHAVTGPLFDWVFANYDYRLILSSTESLETVPVEMGSPDSVGVRPESSVSLILPIDQQLGDVEYDIVYNHETDGTTLQAPVNVGQTLGTVTVYMDGVEYGSSRLVASTTSDISRAAYLRSQLEVMIQTPAVQQIFKILLIVLGIYALLVLFYLFQRIRHLFSLRRARKDRAIARTQQDIQWLDIPEEDEPIYLPPDEKTFDGPFIEDVPPEEGFYEDPPAGEEPAEEYYEESPVEEESAEEYYEEAPAEEEPAEEQFVQDEPEEELPPPKSRRSRKRGLWKKAAKEDAAPEAEWEDSSPEDDPTPSGGGESRQKKDDLFDGLFDDL